MQSGQFEFGSYRLDAQSQMLFREGGHVALPPKGDRDRLIVFGASCKRLPEQDRHDGKPNCCNYWRFGFAGIGPNAS
jgi:hypothetical protein